MRYGIAACLLLLAITWPLAQTPDKLGPAMPIAQPLVKFEGHAGHAVSCIDFSPDGQTVATGSDDKTIAIWDAQTGKELRRIEAHVNEVWTVAFSPDGKKLASGGRADFVVRWWDPATGKSLGTYEGHRGGIPHLQFVGEHHLLSAGGSWDPRILLWDVRAGKQVRSFSGHATLVRRIAASADGKSLASVSDDGTARLWDLNTGEQRLVLASVPDELSCIAMSHDGRTVAIGGTDGSLRLVEACTGQLRLPKIDHDESIRALVLTADGRTLIVAGDDGAILFFDTARLQRQHGFRGHARMIRGLALSPDGKRLGSAANDGRIWDIAKFVEPKPRPPQQPSRHELEVRWDDLGGDAIKAYRTVLALVDGKENAVPFLAEKLKPVTATDSDRIIRLIKDLDSDAFRARDAASKELEQIGDLAIPALRQALSRSPSLDLQRRLEHLLTRLEPVADPETLRVLRALEVLEHAGTAEAKRVVEKLAGGAAEARVTQEAKGALGRMAAMTSGGSGPSGVR